MDILEICRAKIRGRRLTVVFPETADERIVAAARRLRDEDLALPILVEDPAASPRLDDYATLYRQGRPDANAKVARRLAAKPLFHAGLMVKAGDADAMVAGVASPTARVIEAGMMTIGPAAGTGARELGQPRRGRRRRGGVEEHAGVTGERQPVLGQERQHLDVALGQPVSHELKERRTGTGSPPRVAMLPAPSGRGAGTSSY